MAHFMKTLTQRAVVEKIMPVFFKQNIVQNAANFDDVTNFE